MICVDSCNMATTENAESGSPENKWARADPDAKYPLKTLYCGGERIHIKYTTANANCDILIKVYNILFIILNNSGLQACNNNISLLFYLQCVLCQ